MAAEKRHPENDPHDQTLIDDVTELVFKNYEPPEPEPSPESAEDEDEESADNHAAA